MNVKKFLDDLKERLRQYYGQENKPVVFVRAETDLLVRMTTTFFALKSARIRKEEQSPDHGDLLNLDHQQDLIDLSLVTSIAKKLTESEN